MNKLQCCHICISAMMLSGCSIDDHVNSHKENLVSTQSNMRRRLDDFRNATSNAQTRIDAQSVNKPWLAGKAIPLARELTLPKALQRNVETTMIFQNRRATLVTLAENLTLATNIPIRISPEALMPQDYFAPKLSPQTQQSQGQVAMEILSPAGAQPLAQILDTIARRLNVHWRFQNSSIEFYRTQTKVFDVKVLSMSASSDMALGRTGNSSSGGFESNARTVLKAPEAVVLDSIKLKIEPFLSRAGIVSAQVGSATSIVVTDTPEVLDAIQQFIDRENRVLTRRIRLVFEELTVETNESFELGIDWSFLFTADKVALSVQSPVMAVASETAKSLVSLSSDTANPVKLALQALSKQGRVLRHTSMPIMTLNRRPVTHAVRTTFSYIDQVKTSGATGTGQTKTEQGFGSVSVSQKEETVGAFLTILPDAQDDGQILLSIAYDNTVAQPLKTISFGEKGRSLDIQQITIDGTGTVQQMSLKSGQSMLISGFERLKEQSEQTRLTEDAPVLTGGGDRLGRKKIVTVILLTALMEEG